MNESLLKPYTTEEVKEALFSIGDYKAPGTDGLHAIFFKKFWSVVGDQVTTEVLQALNTGVIPEGWNETAIVLIPKGESPELVTQFRPISLCNVMYKVIAKVLAKRLKMILPEIISPTQSAFVSGRLISDNVLVAYECFHTIKKRRQRNNGIFAIKLDMNKAYDRVEWGFFKDMMLRLDFSESWVSMIMACVTSVNYMIWFNSDETDCFSPSRGIRQGDHLSPYLFLLCSEGLSSLLEFEEVTGGIQGVRVCRSAPAISHLLFADDSLILMNDDVSNATALRKVLDLYCASSGQLVSEANSSVFFSPNTRVEIREVICRKLNIVTESLSDKYLGLPTLVGADRSDSFQHLIDRINQRNEKLLSMGGKEILLKAIAQSIPVYAMSVFNLPKKICKEINNAIARYWWGGTEQNRKIHWMAWWKMSVPKQDGGMGFRDLHS
jgi:hypothetical protein